ncbi:hypothetical protein QTO31_04715 [Chloroflexus sp. MS-CIW-1]|uniref:hypothetical protein n=1 Tax=Chloroflexus sp. MS-CIW-1 TaxID=3055768 RepID=UPI0026494089|nr:hypothetical protein [Chloroflexus sp. MS-CIW-1]MDN5271267.1 hypothetical protein [Chloroflexus sp. MS-CIW-1]
MDCQAMLQQIIEIPRSERSSQIHAEQPLVWVGGQRVAAPGTGGPQARAPSFVAAPGTGGPQAHAPSFVAAPGTGGPQARAPSFVAAPGTGGPQARAPSFLHNLLSGLAAGGLRLKRTSGTPASRLER